MDRWKEGMLDGQSSVDGRMEGMFDGQRDRVEWMHGQTDGWLGSGWMDGLMSRRLMHGDGWMDG